MVSFLPKTLLHHGISPPLPTRIRRITSRDRRRRDNVVASCSKATVCTSVPLPSTCADAAVDARQVLRALREMKQSERPSRVRMELPLPQAGVENDKIVYLGKHGQLADWSGGMRQRFRATRPLVDTLLEGRQANFAGLLEDAEDGVGVWACDGDITVLTHVADTTAGLLFKLLRGEYGSAPTREGAMVCVVNAFWTDGGEKVGNPWEFKLREEARDVLKAGSWEVVYCLRAVRTAAGVPGTIWRRYPEPWLVLDETGRVVLSKEGSEEPSSAEVAEALNRTANATE